MKKGESRRQRKQPVRRKGLDCLDFKRRAQARIYGDTKDMTHEEEIEYLHRRAREGSLGAWWRSIGDHPAAVRETPPTRKGGKPG